MSRARLCPCDLFELGYTPEIRTRNIRDGSLASSCLTPKRNMNFSNRANSRTGSDTSPHCRSIGTNRASAYISLPRAFSAFRPCVCFRRPLLRRRARVDSYYSEIRKIRLLRNLSEKRKAYYSSALVPYLACNARRIDRTFDARDNNATLKIPRGK